MHSPKPLSASEILKTMPTNKSIDDIYKKMSAKGWYPMEQAPQEKITKVKNKFAGM